jgi:hypothetical protein
LISKKPISFIKRKVPLSTLEIYKETPKASEKVSISKKQRVNISIVQKYKVR